MRDDGALVVVVDDDEAICRAVARMLGAHGYRVQTYTNPRRYLNDSDALNPTCVLIDIRMPDLDGLELLRSTRRDGVDAPTVFMTATGDVPTIVAAMKEGAVDLLAKPFTADQLAAAIGRAISSAAHTDHERRALTDLWRVVEGLTPREAEVCGLVACGLLNKHVAAIIGTKEKTVKVHRGRVMQKLGVASVAELVRLVDALLRDAKHDTVRLDALDITRPRAVDIIIDVVARERARLTASATASTTTPAVDHGTMPAAP